jgi:predicted Zn-dependent peptidase
MVQIKALQNGLRLIYLQTNGEVSHLGLFVGAGTKHENRSEMGIAHFLEHCVFKGTKKRKSYHILNRLEVVGGELNAYTAKEETVIHASVQKNDTKRAFELIADISQNPTFPKNEIEKEKDVVLEEINSYLDSPAEQIFDEFDAALFPNHPLGHNILGEVETVKNFSTEHLFNFHNNFYHPDNAVFCYVGPENLNKILRLAETYFASWNGSTHKKNLEKPVAADFFRKSIEQDTFQAHLILGGLAYHYKDGKKTAFAVLNNLLGGPGLNSRLNLSVREKHGLAYHIDSSYNTFDEIGTFQIYAATEKSQLAKTEKLIKKELKKLCEQKLGSLQLHQLKKQILGQLAIANEYKGSLMIGLGKSLLHLNKIETDEEIAKKIIALSADDLLEVANEIFIPENLYCLTIT